MYSKEALEAIAIFYGKDFSVFVEGEDDVIFWESHFELAGSNNVHFQDVGGVSELKPYIEMIENEDAKIIVACDSDHRFIFESESEHPRIVYTYGYSIENSMYRPETIQTIIRRLSIKSPPSQEEILNWQNEFSDNCKSLLVHSIANERSESGISVFGDKCVRFLDGSYQEIDSAKVDDFIENDCKDIQVEQSDIDAINTCEKRLWYCLKGHFLTNAVMNFITNQAKILRGRKVHLSLDALYAFCVDLRDLKRKDYNDIVYVNTNILLAIQSL